MAVIDGGISPVTGRKTFANAAIVQRSLLFVTTPSADAAARLSEPTSVTIRPYRPEDEEAVVGLWSRATRIAHPFIAEEDTGERERKLRQIYLVHADNWVAELPDRGVVGLLGMLDAEIGGLFVDPGVQKSGIGRQLVAHALRLHPTVTLDVFELNSSARAFYARLGFREITRHLDPDTGFTLI
ncbi:GNAT family N-acetyltransferase, partial [Streptomyces sp. NPDC059083]|uniref:GNAT family N-acetyltransferase n=1 Tax=Streptomyces sp. NPDC059083 TaxID=3346721 RepID=UPI0036BDC357